MLVVSTTKMGPQIFSVRTRLCECNLQDGWIGREEALREAEEGRPLSGVLLCFSLVVVVSLADFYILHCLQLYAIP